jgi:hypothetical protein
MAAKKMKKNRGGLDAAAGQLPAPTPGALDVLAMLWFEKQHEDRPLPLSKVHRLVCARREVYGEPAAPLSTVLRSRNSSASSSSKPWTPIGQSRLAGPLPRQCGCEAAIGRRFARP